MSTSFGERLLGEVHEEGLDELLRDLRDLLPGTVEDGSRLGVHDLDALLGVFMPLPGLPARAQDQSETRDWEQDVFPEDLDEHGDQHRQMHTEEDRAAAGADRMPVGFRVRRGDPVIEVSSTSSAAGKTELLYYLTAVAVLPSIYNGIRLDGRDSAVVFFDTDGRFDIQRLRTIALGILNRKIKIHANQIPQDRPEEKTNPNPSTPPEELETIIRTALQHIHIFRPPSSSSLLATLQNLETYLLDTSRHLSAARPLHAIFIDSATAFFWQDKLHDEVARTENIGRSTADLDHQRTQKRIFSLADTYSGLVQELKSLQRRFGCIVAYTCNASGGRSFPDPQRYGQQGPTPSGPFDPYTTPGNMAASSQAFRCPLPPPWGGFPTLRLIVHRGTLRPFPPMATVRDARQVAMARQKMVRRGRLVGRVNEWGCEDWPRRIKEELGKRNGGVFTFHVGRDGVEFT